MAKNVLKLNMKGFEELMTKYDALGGDMKQIAEEALNQAAKTITDDTNKGVQKPMLPAGGYYSGGETAASVVSNPKVEWSGNKAEVGVGFDFAKPGAGGFLIKGRYSPTHMSAASYLKMVYTGKTYMKNVKKEMEKIVQKAIDERMG